MNRLMTSALAIALLCLTTNAQGGRMPGRLKSASTTIDASAALEVSFRIPVSGLQKDNIDGVRASLADLSVETRECDKCLFVALAEGTCPTCESPLIPTRRNNVRALRPVLETGELVLYLDARLPTRLSVIEKALAAHSVQVRSKTLAIPDASLLVLHGPEKIEPARIEKALTGNGLFERASVTVAPAGREYVVAVAATEGALPVQDKAALAVSSLNLELADVIVGDRSTIVR